MAASENGPKAPFIERFLATGFFAGYIPWAPGTWGTVVGVLLYLLIPHSDTPWVLAMFIIAFFFVGVRSAATMAEVVGHQLSKSAAWAKTTLGQDQDHAPDPSIVVIDEIVGMWITMLALPKSAPAVIIGFILFRVCDILKPPPAANVERLKHGWGIMLDDVVAGVYANVLTRAVLWVSMTYVGGLL
jgi:phosphatidylglycerophosphatase A